MDLTDMPEAKFETGRWVASAAIANWLADENPTLALTRLAGISGAVAQYVTGDWGEVDNDDKRANDNALVHGDRLLAAYHLEDPNLNTTTKIWIITEADRSATTILFPSDY